MLFILSITLAILSALSVESATNTYQLNGRNVVTVTTAHQRCCAGSVREVTTDLTAVLFDRSSSRSNFGSNFNTRMAELDQHAGDQKGHILASVLGGPAVTWNLAPQAENINHKLRATTSVLNTWYDCEKWIRDQLKSRRHLPIRVSVHLSYSSAGGCRPTHWSIRASNANNSDGCSATNIPNGIDRTFGVCQAPRRG